MSYFPRMPPPQPFYDGYYDGAYDEYGFYGGYGYGSPRQPPPRGGPWRGRGRGGWAGSGGRGAATGGGSAVVTVKTVLTPQPAASVPASTTAVAVKTELGTEASGATPAAAVKSVPSVPNGAPASATAAAIPTAAAAVPAPAAGTQTAAVSATAASTEATEVTGVKRTADTALSDEHPFPESVTDKFFPNRCELCSVVFPVARDIFIPEKGGMDYMESNLQSTMHYSGKCHKKRLRQFMQDYCRKNRLITPRRARELMRDTPAVPRASDKQEMPKVDLYCKTCDLSFTSVQHASQHYAGKNHQRKVEGKPPLRSGYYNARTGRWQRLPPGMEQDRPFPPRPYQPRPPFPGGGVTRPAAPAPTTADPSVVTVQVAPGNLVNAGVKLSPDAAAAAAAAAASGAQSKFHCEICGVSATCQLQLDTHMTGSRHKMQAKRLGFHVPADKPAAAAAKTEAAGTGTGAAAEPAAKRPRRDYSIYKTPSGKFYCLPCNLTMNSETQFAQHFESKKHLAEVARQRSSGGATH